jgi:uncharacterized protein YjdB
VSPLGAPNGFTVSNSAPGKATATKRRESVIIKGIATGTATITVVSTANTSETATIAVTITA